MSQLIAVINQSTVVNNTDAALMTQAVASQVRLHATPTWNSWVQNVLFYPDPKQVPAGALPMYLLDNADQAGALGYHTEDPNGSIYGRIFCKTITDNGGSILTGNISVSGCLSHECLELIGDPLANGWSMAADGVTCWAQELCDYVEGDGYVIDVNGTSVMVSNFVLPEWFNPTPAKDITKFDWMGKLTAPFTMDAGGYGIYFSAGQAQQQMDATVPAKPEIHLVHGPKCPKWYLDMKAHPAARTMKRGADVSKARMIQV